MNELTAFSGALDAALDASGVSPDELTVEVSSAGAEREVRIPRDLGRFTGLPMLVRYKQAGGGNGDGTAPATAAEVLELETYDVASGTTVWKLANVRANRAGLKKGQPLNKKLRERRINLRFEELLKVNLHMDI